MFATTQCKQGKVKCQTKKNSIYNKLKTCINWHDAKNRTFSQSTSLEAQAITSILRFVSLAVIKVSQAFDRRPDNLPIHSVCLETESEYIWGWACKHLTIIGSLHYHFMILSIVHYWSAILELMRLQSLKLKMLYQYFAREFGQCCRPSSLFVYDPTIFYQYGLVNAGCVAMLAWVGPVMVQLYHQNARPTHPRVSNLSKCILAWRKLLLLGSCRAEIVGVNEV